MSTTKATYTATFILGDGTNFTVTFKSSKSIYSTGGARYLVHYARTTLRKINNVPEPVTLVRMTVNGKTVYEK